MGIEITLAIAQCKVMYICGSSWAHPYESYKVSTVEPLTGLSKTTCFPHSWLIRFMFNQPLEVIVWPIYKSTTYFTYGTCS